jgi:nucleotide-binding universal stress UspA family protein
MYHHMLIPTDGSELAQKGVDHGLSLAKTLGAKVTLITITEPFPIQASATTEWVPLPGDMSRYEEGQKQFAEKLLASAKASAEKMGLETKVIYVPNAFPAEAIIEAAKSEDCSLIVMASHGRRGLSRLLLGSQTTNVLTHSPIPVLVVR